MSWSAENDKADSPYVIYGNEGGRLFRMPIKMDDWDYEEKNLSPNDMYKKLTECVSRLVEDKLYGAMGFHPWVIGRNDERIRVFYDFIDDLTKNDGITVLTFSQACGLFGK